MPIVQTVTPECADDPCCVKHLNKSIAKRTLETAEHWDCPDCGCEWLPREVDGIRVWRPCVFFAIFKH